MSKTEYLGIDLVDKKDDMPTIDWMQMVNGNVNSSMAMLVDSAIGKLLIHEIYSSEQPQNQSEGDVWNEIISETEEGGS